MLSRVVYSSEKTDWETPQELFDELDAEFHFTLDAAATAENALCDRYYTEADDGLSQCWDGEIVFCNPPYGSRITDAWVKKGSEIKRGICVMLLVARTDTKRFHRYIYHQAEIRFIESRVHFGQPGLRIPALLRFPA